MGVYFNEDKEIYNNFIYCGDIYMNGFNIYHRITFIYSLKKEVEFYDNSMTKLIA
jgi:hypothetical protein